jgi:hypothetical protein
MTPARPAEANKTDFANPAEVAVEVTEIKGQVALLAQQVSTGLSNVSSQLGSLQGDVRDVQKGLQLVANQQHDIQAHSTGLDRLAKAIEAHVAASQEWQRTHVAENQAVADQVKGWRGMVIGFGIAASLLSAAAIYIVQDGFARDAAERARIEAIHVSDTNRLERVIERNQADIRELQQARAVK